MNNHLINSFNYICAIRVLTIKNIVMARKALTEEEKLKVINENLADFQKINRKKN